MRGKKSLDPWEETQNAWEEICIDILTDGFPFQTGQPALSERLCGGQASPGLLRKSRSIGALKAKCKVSLPENP